MSKISDKKKIKICEEILRVLYDTSPKDLSTYHIANEVLRDNEFVLGLLRSLEERSVIVGLSKVNKGKMGESVFKATKKSKKKRIVWRMTDRSFKEYQNLLGSSYSP